MTRKPDEIKKALECCIDGFSCRTTCPYTTPFFNIEKCTQALATDALALIQQLEERCKHMNDLRDAAAERALKMEERVRQLEAELEDMTTRYKIADDCAKKKGEMNDKLYAELTAVKAERDAAVADLKSYRCCHWCKHLGVGFNEPCLHCDFENNCFE